MAAIADEPWSLKLSNILSKHRYVRFGYTHIRPDGKASHVKDETGPIVRYGDESTPGLAPSGAALGTLYYLSQNLRADHPDDYLTSGLGAPTNASVRVVGGGSPIIALGTYLDEEHRWSAETYVAGLPIRGSVHGAGRIGGEGSDAVDLGEVATSDQLGPIVIGRHHFGSKSDRLRLSVGVAATWIYFFNTRATSSLETYVGGPSKISIKPAFGVGPVVGASYQINERWSIHGMVGKMKMRTQATISTKTDPEVVARSLAVVQSARDAGANTLNALDVILGPGTTLQQDIANLNQPGNPMVTVLRELAVARTGDASNLGTYKRKITVDVDPLIFNLSVGYDF